MFDQNRKHMHNFTNVELFLPLLSLFDNCEFINMVTPEDDDDEDDCECINMVTSEDDDDDCEFIHMTAPEDDDDDE